VGDGDRVRIESPRGAIEAPVRVTGVRDGVVFVPFHYGYWDRDAEGPDGAPARAANELTITSWDPVSKQPLFKVGAVCVSPVA
jgi:ferredoxin-nitrate reductase